MWSDINPASSTYTLGVSARTKYNDKKMTLKIVKWFLQVNVVDRGGRNVTSVIW